ncbi:MAG TPA: plastocyanin/azurin family copper-binding protein [Gaiellaceae bacterium]
MQKIVILVVLVGLASVLVASALAGQKATKLTLVGTVGPGYMINLKVGGKNLVRLKAGTYTFVIHDRASIHAWSLDGPNGFAKDLTAVPFVGPKTVTLKLKAGKYKFYCPPHEAMMFGHFTVVA